MSVVLSLALQEEGRDRVSEYWVCVSELVKKYSLVYAPIVVNNRSLKSPLMGVHGRQDPSPRLPR